jgi:hypothetical protein
MDGFDCRLSISSEKQLIASSGFDRSFRKKLPQMEEIGPLQTVEFASQIDQEPLVADLSTP